MAGTAGTTRPEVSGGRVPRWIAVPSTMIGALVGTATNLYSDEVRGLLESSGKDILSALPRLLLPAVAASVVTAIVLLGVARVRKTVDMAERQVHIRVEALHTVSNETDMVVGREIRYLEVKRRSNELIILLHGLGLDASDFRSFLIEAKHHCIALTQYGFNASDRSSADYRPISLQTHVELLAYALLKIKQQYPKKRITLVGFSFGADMLFFLNQFSPQTLPALGPTRAILLDPNVNRTTTTISSRISSTRGNDPSELTQVLESATTLQEFRYLCEYLYKITNKNLDQVRRLAREVVEMWATDGVDVFMAHLEKLRSVVPNPSVYLSSNHEDLFNRIVHEGIRRDIDMETLSCPRVDHFELISPQFLRSLF